MISLPINANNITLFLHIIVLDKIQGVFISVSMQIPARIMEKLKIHVPKDTLCYDLMFCNNIFLLFIAYWGGCKINKYNLCVRSVERRFYCLIGNYRVIL